jgi:hypothetical protein
MNLPYYCFFIIPFGNMHVQPVGEEEPAEVSAVWFGPLQVQWVAVYKRMAELHSLVINQYLVVYFSERDSNQERSTSYSSLRLSLLRWGFFSRKPLAAGSHNWPPAPLGWKLTNARNATTVENNRNWAKLLLHDVYFHSQ